MPYVAFLAFMVSQAGSGRRVDDLRGRREGDFFVASAAAARTLATDISVESLDWTSTNPETTR